MDVTAIPWVTESTLQNTSDLVVSQRPLNMELLIFNLVKIIISLIGVSGNGVVLWLLAFHMQRNVFPIYILNLAGADFVLLSSHMIFSILDLVGDIKLDFIMVFQYIMFVFPYIVGLSILTAISTERCLSILKPIWYHCHRPKHMSSIVCALFWALSLLLIILKMGFCRLLFRYYTKYLCKITHWIIITWPIFSFMLLFVSSLVLLTRLLCGSRKMKLTRLYVTIGLTVLVFLLCALPWGIAYVILYWLPIVHFKDYIIVHAVTDLLTCVNSCANPIIYFFVGSYRQQKRQQRRSLKVILQRALQDFPEEDGRQGSPSGNTHVT